MFYKPDAPKPRPLLIGLHTWSGDYQQVTNSSLYAQWCVEHDWVFLHPDFRGPNIRPEAAGSELVIGDITSIIEFAHKHAVIDISRIYLVGASGGGHVALLFAGRLPNIWAAVSAWVPISDIGAWYHQCRERNLGYADDIVKSCGGIPSPGSAAEIQCSSRSPLTYLANAQMPIDLNAGIHDGYTGSVPVSQTLNAFNALATQTDRLSPTHIDYIVKNRAISDEFRAHYDDPFYGEKKVLFRRQSRNVRVTIFDGGHEIVHSAALNWLSKQQKA
jgi:dipeptidyl aminopeptidase/acylaminoacyl peptidase